MRFQVQRGVPPEFPRREPYRRSPADPAAPGADAPAQLDPWLQQRLFDQRMVMLQGLITPQAASSAAAQLLALEAMGSSRIRLAEPRVDDVSGTADQIVGQASRHLQMLEDLILRLADVTGKPRSQLETDLSDGRLLSAPEALEYGLIDEVVGSGSTG